MSELRWERQSASVRPGGKTISYFGDVRANVYAVDAGTGLSLWTLLLMIIRPRELRIACILRRLVVRAGVHQTKKRPPCRAHMSCKFSMAQQANRPTPHLIRSNLCIG